MACCACCCGGEDCEEGQEGKCCCGGAEGTCCQEGEYCCDGVCEDEPCGEPCEVYEDCTYNCVSSGGEECELDGSNKRLFPDTTQGLQDALAYLGSLGPECAAGSVDLCYGSCCDDACFPSQGDLPITLPDLITCP